ncbi:SH3 and PX-domain-containing 3 [Mycena chlorophos]|uniref:SH3 and PX-domain-containing 3 n=1 Tax=Mycena chlorophos TaxID=658473 RepID=A0A8H6TLW0_MYCCL|nr:SH3 and PX-domain-containing 3 [Mycena chlorophos]
MNTRSRRSFSTRWLRYLFFIFLVALVVFWRVRGRAFADVASDGASAIPEAPVAYMSNAEAVDLLGHPTFENAWAHERSLPQHTKTSRIVAGRHKPRYVSSASKCHLLTSTKDICAFQMHLGERAGIMSSRNSTSQPPPMRGHLTTHRLLNAHLAQLSDRAYVFPAYIPRDHPPFPDTLPNGTRHMLHIPMNAFVAGPVAGGPLSDDPTADILTRRSISEEWWDIVCPRKSVKVLNVYHVHNEFGYNPEAVEGAEILSKWAKKLREMDDMCVSVEEFSIFHYSLIGSPLILSAWPSYSSSPVLRQFAWSQLVARAIFENLHAVAPSAPTIPGYLAPIAAIPPNDQNPFVSFAPLRASSAPIPGLLGIHVRRGDYQGHCEFLVAIEAEYNAWNNLGSPEFLARAHAAAEKWGIQKGASAAWPQLPDGRTIPAGMAKQDALKQHCYPEIDHIVHRAAEVRKGAASSSPLTTVFIATNGKREWVSKLVHALHLDGWGHVATSMDLHLGPEAWAVSQAVDMGILSVLAEEFIGVGFSSLSSNVAQIRLGAGKAARTIHFW